MDLGKKWVIFRTSGLDDLDDQSVVVDHETDERSYEVLCLQLRAAAERHAAQLCKALLNELERRLLQRAHSGWFETYLATIGLLNCIERSSWLMRTWNYEKYQREVRRAILSAGRLLVASADRTSFAPSGLWIKNRWIFTIRASASRTCYTCC